MSFCLTCCVWHVGAPGGLPKVSFLQWTLADGILVFYVVSDISGHLEGCPRSGSLNGL